MRVIWTNALYHYAECPRYRTHRRQYMWVEVLPVDRLGNVDTQCQHCRDWIRLR